MDPNRVRRRLAAILSADAVGYSRLMAEDEAAAVRTVNACREAMAAQIRRGGGRMVDAPDNKALAEFASVVDAVRCGVEIQRELEARNSALPRGRRMRFRIGIDFGDVIAEDREIYGDGVNVAARLEQLAEPGGICVSGTVYDQVHTKIPLGYESLGGRSVENGSSPLRVYRVDDSGAEAQAVAAPEAERHISRPWQRALALAGLVLLLGAAVLTSWMVLAGG